MRRQNLFLWLVALILILACAPSAITPFPTTDPDAINTFIVQTAGAASTLTAAVAPPSSPTGTTTPVPRNTEPPSPTATVTFIFILPGSTSSLSAPTLAGITSGTINSDYGCNVFSTEPTNGTTFAPRADFTVTWGVKNIGKETWFRATMNYVFVSGDKLHKVSSYDIPKGVESGKNVFLPVEMEAFKNRGTYTTKWALVEDNHYFCPMTLTIVVN